MNARLFVLAHQQARERAADYVLRQAPEGYEVKIVPPARSTAQSALLHAMLGFISQRIEWAGEYRDVSVWKRLLIAAWLRARGSDEPALPAVDGQGVDIVFRPSSSLSRGEMAELIDYIFAWGCSMELEFPEAPPSRALAAPQPRALRGPKE